MGATRAGRWAIEIAMASSVFLIDLSADLLQQGLGAPVEVRVVTNVGIFLGAFATYMAVRYAAMRSLGTKWGRTAPLSEALFGKKR